MANQSDKHVEEPAHTTPGRPTESGSRQQSDPDQTLESGSKSFDHESGARSKNTTSKDSTP